MIADCCRLMYGCLVVQSHCRSLCQPEHCLQYHCSPRYPSVKTNTQQLNRNTVSSECSFSVLLDLMKSFVRIGLRLSAGEPEGLSTQFLKFAKFKNDPLEFGAFFEATEGCRTLTV